ncbi:MAG TPA: ABC transporter substrate-binding protein [Fimbriimonadaceae bacterium]|nr:ABC transporter substrate-binding protein [Fimbriimonadaceae bacterium]HRJ97827.1 ABC transporter substrate-binding protein [Fimbriimonadaceae bacterium]
MKPRRMTAWTSLIALAMGIALLPACGPKTDEGGTTGGDTKTTGSTTSGASSGTSGTTSSRKAPTASGNTASGDTIKIGLVASLNGELKPWGDDCEKGARLAVEEFNAAGGVNGKKIELRIEDSASKAEQGRSATDKLIAEGCLGIIGEVASGITLQMANSCFDKGVPIVAVGATRVDITDIGSNVFRVCYTDDFQGPVMAKFAYDDLGLRKVAIMTDQAQPYSTGLSDNFRKKFVELGGEIVDEQFYRSPEDKQFGPQLQQIKEKAPVGLFLSGYFTEVGAIARQAKEAGLNVKMLGGDGWDSAELNTSGGAAIVGGFFCNHYNNEEARPEVQQFLSKWQAKYNSKPATTMGALGYDATMLVCDALKRASALDSKALTDAIEATENFPGVSGMITLKGNNGNPPKRALVVEVTSTGQKFAKAFEPGSL